MKKWFFLLVLIPIAFFLSIWLVAIGDSIPHEKASFAEMIMAFSPVMKAAKECWAEQQINITDCPAAKALMPEPKVSNTAYFMTAEGTLLGINYESRVVVILLPRVERDGLIWYCAASPQEAVGKLCDGTALANLEPTNIISSNHPDG